MQSPSSLIFIVLLGVWAAYFVQYWIRRRDHLATARSVEQFSAAMRVLERRSPIPRTDLSDPAPRSWSVHPARPVRPQVVVKRAVPAEMPSPMSPRPAGRPVPETARPAARPAAAPAAVRPSRRVRASVFVLAVLGSLATAGLAGLSLVPPWAPLVAVGGLVLALAWVRAGVRAERAARAARRRRAVQEARRRAAAVPGSAAPGRRGAGAGSATAGRSRADGELVAPVEVMASSSSDGSAADVDADRGEVAEAASRADAAVQRDAVEPVASEPVAVEPVAVEPEPEPEPVIEYVHLVDEDDIPLTWDPVPVPRPTYTMKAKAERPEVAPADVTPTPAPGHAALRLREDEVDERRVAGA
ncbi:hypothetical protein [uncultured Phycicoccus sp.]|uniref:hypothetical protein n=1 Tax=uncultured Phycicoccus sp. TaxID=661422 RepID=UPI002625C74D|nr:hypothetical protein [uncultured Phycicoccus sp.]